VHGISELWGGESLCCHHGNSAEGLWIAAGAGEIIMILWLSKQLAAEIYYICWDLFLSSPSPLKHTHTIPVVKVTSSEVLFLHFFDEVFQIWTSQHWGNEPWFSRRIWRMPCRDTMTRGRRAQLCGWSRCSWSGFLTHLWKIVHLYNI
jgi:hypothetical protein